MTRHMTMTGTIMAALVVVTIVSVSGLYRSVHAQTDEGLILPQTREVSVVGEAEVQVQPDMAIAQIGVETEAPTASEALAQNNERSQAVQDRLAELGIAGEDIETVRFSLSPIRERAEPPEPGDGAITGYRVTHIMGVTIRDLDQVAAVLDAAVQAGANQVFGISFTRTDVEAVLEAARAAAIHNARTKAEHLATAAGATLGEIVTISEQRSPGPPVPAVEGGPGAPPPPVEPGLQQLRVEVSVTYVLQ